MRSTTIGHTTRHYRLVLGDLSFCCSLFGSITITATTSGEDVRTDVIRAARQCLPACSALTLLAIVSLSVCTSVTNGKCRCLRPIVWMHSQHRAKPEREREIVLPLAIYSCAEDFLSLADSIAANSPPPPPSTAFISISFSIYRQSLSHSLSSLSLALCCCFSCLWRRLIRFAIWYAQARLPLRKIRAVIQLLAAKCKKERELWQSRNLRSLRVISSLQARFTISSTDSLYRRMDPSFVLLCCVGWVRPFGSRRRA